jgi:hypothetical protein
VKATDFSAYGCAYHGGHSHHRCLADDFCGHLRRHCGWIGALSKVRRPRPFGEGIESRLEHLENSLFGGNSNQSLLLKM